MTIATFSQTSRNDRHLCRVSLTKQEPLLTTHDCIYLKQKLSASQITDITYQLQQTYPYLRFEYEPIFPIATQEQIEKRNAELNQFEQAHREHIRREEIYALDK